MYGYFVESPLVELYLSRSFLDVVSPVTRLCSSVFWIDFVSLIGHK